MRQVDTIYRVVREEIKTPEVRRKAKIWSVLVLLFCLISISFGSLIPNIVQADNEIKKPTSFTDSSVVTINEVNAYDSDQATYSTTSTGTDGFPSVTWHTWQTTSNTYTALTLYVRRSASGNVNDLWWIEYSINGGSNWDYLENGGFTNPIVDNLSVSLSTSQDLSLVQVRVGCDKQQGGDGGNVYIYDIWTDGVYTPILGVSASVSKSSISWFGETELQGTPTGGLDYTNYPQGSVRAKIVTPSATGYAASTVYKEMTYDSGDGRWEVVYKTDADGYGAGMADVRTGAYSVTIQLDSESPYFSVGDVDAEYTNGTSFSTFVVRRWPAKNIVKPSDYTDFIPTWNTDHWDYDINDFGIVDTVAHLDTTIRMVVYPTTATVTNVTVAGQGFTVLADDGYSTGDYWDEDTHTIVFKMDTIAGNRFVDIDFDSSTDLFGTHQDRYQTNDIGVRDTINGLTIANSKITIGMFGGGHEGAGEYIDMHAKETTESTIDCMERPALWVDDAVNIDASGYYNANIKWEQDKWMEWMTGQNDGEIIIENYEDSDALTGWEQKKDYNIDVHRTITIRANEGFVKNEYEFTNNGAASHKMSFVWGREQWLEGPSVTGSTNDREYADLGMFPDDATDYTAAYNLAGSSLSKTWFSTYDSVDYAYAGMVFNDYDPITRAHFNTGIAYSSYASYMPIFSATPYANYPIPSPGSLGVSTAESMWLEKVWDTVAVGETVTQKFLHVGGKNITRANIDTYYDTLATPTFGVSPVTQSGSGGPSSTVTYAHTITNNASHADRIYLSTDDEDPSAEGWTSQVWNSGETSQITYVDLDASGGANDSVDVKVKTSIPAGALGPNDTALVGESNYNTLTVTAVDTTSVSSTSAAITILEVYDPNTLSFDTTDPFDVNYGTIQPATDYIVGEGGYDGGEDTHAVKIDVDVFGATYDLQVRGLSNFSSGVPIGRLYYAQDLGVPDINANGSWTAFTLTDAILADDALAGTDVIYYYDYKLALLYDDPIGSSQVSILYTVVTN